MEAEKQKRSQTPKWKHKMEDERRDGQAVYAELRIYPYEVVLY